jgi:hypothetical protein
MDGRCATCRHWDRSEGSDPTPIGWYDQDEFPAPPSPYGVCGLTAYYWDGKYRHPSSKALSVDGEGYRAELATLPDFGCVQWEPKGPGTDG